MNCAVISKVGSREINEDAALALMAEGVSCFVVADGLGGHDLGEVASQSVVDTLRAELEARPKEQSVDEFLREAMRKAQQQLMDKQEELHANSKMKTTCVALACSEDKVAWAHVGDSRCYAFRRNKVVARTLDHSVPQMMVLSREIKEKDIRNHPDRNLLLRVMGIPWDRDRHEVSEVHEKDKFQAFLLCSDGFWELITEKQMSKHLKKSSSVEEWLERMTQEVEETGNGGDMDNYTAVAVWN